MSKIKSFLIHNSVILVFIISFSATFGSLYLSEILNLDPCRLCWYQRILMYSVAILSAVSIIFKIHLRKIFILCFTIPGMALSAYHYYIQLSAGDSPLNTCGGGVSCNFIDFRIFGFVTIPLLAFFAFSLITIVVLVSNYLNKNNRIA